MKTVVFKWIDEDGPTQQVCTSYDEIVEFIEANQNDVFGVAVWDE